MLIPIKIKTKLKTIEKLLQDLCLTVERTDRARVMGGLNVVQRDNIKL